MSKFLITIFVEVDDEDVCKEEGEDSIFCGTTGDVYENYQEFFEHQLGRDLQCITLVPGHDVKVVPEEDIEEEG